MVVMDANARWLPLSCSLYGLALFDIYRFKDFHPCVCNRNKIIKALNTMNHISTSYSEYHTVLSYCDIMLDK